MTRTAALALLASTLLLCVTAQTQPVPTLCDFKCLEGQYIVGGEANWSLTGSSYDVAVKFMSDFCGASIGNTAVNCTGDTLGSTRRVLQANNFYITEQLQNLTLTPSGALHGRTFDVDDNAQVRVQCDDGRSCGCWALGQGAGLLHQYYCQGLGGFAIFREAEDNGREDGANELFKGDTLVCTEADVRKDRQCPASRSTHLLPVRHTNYSSPPPPQNTLIVTATAKLPAAQAELQAALGPHRPRLGPDRLAQGWGHAAA
ncbi:hypothetical protein B0H14DRAFT_3171052 [Mycena olivaceomarginata]|nr:hypothetical protein B0H14DRAFT_3171052 [Mycena olivaceomarginata]